MLFLCVFVHFFVCNVLKFCCVYCFCLLRAFFCLYFPFLLAVFLVLFFASYFEYSESLFYITAKFCLFRWSFRATVDFKCQNFKCSLDGAKFYEMANNIDRKFF